MGTLSAAMQQGLFLEPGSRQPRMLCLLNTIADIAGALCCLHADGYIHGHVSGDRLVVAPSYGALACCARLTGLVGFGEESLVLKGVRSE